MIPTGSQRQRGLRPPLSFQTTCQCGRGTFAPMRHLFAPTLLVLASACAAQPPAGYYDPAAGLTGEPLRQALHDIIDNHTVLSYSSLWTAFETSDDRPDGYVWDIYSDIPSGTPPYLYTFGTDQCGTYNSEGDCYNREHSFPKSWFNDASPMLTDLHHIYPTDGWVNTKRGDLPYGEVGSADWTGMNGTKTGLNVWPGYGGTVCEPRDEFKGDLARTYFYMLTRYAPEASAWNCDMLSGGNFAPWAEAMLVQWNADDPISTKETDRNNAVFALQGNRNPYIDHPEWVASIWGPFAGIHEAEPIAPSVSMNNGVLSVRGMNAPCTLDVLDVLGRTLLSTSLRGDSDIPVGLPIGTYLCRWSMGARSGVLRFTR